MGRYQEPKGFRFDKWQDFIEFMTEEDVKNCINAEIKAENDNKNPCPKCGGKANFLNDIKTKMSTRCINCGFTRRYEPIMTYKD